MIKRIQKNLFPSANELSRVLKDISRDEKFTKFDINYLPNPFQKVIYDWVLKGGEVWQLIEKVDSLHPTQVRDESFFITTVYLLLEILFFFKIILSFSTQAAQSMIADSIWEYIESQYPHVLGPVNARNELIEALFQNQGGH